MWRPIAYDVDVGAVIDVGLYADPDSGRAESIGAVEVIFQWDPTRLALLGNVDPCPDAPCPAGMYAWLSSGFPDDSLGDGINTTHSDGDALFVALTRFSPVEPAVAPPAGLWITSMRFQTLRTGRTNVGLVPNLGGFAQTRVLGGDIPIDVTGALGGPAEVAIRCFAPALSTAGCRYLSIQASPATGPIALMVSGAPDVQAVACVSSFVQADGSLSEHPIYQLPSAWNTVFVSGHQIIPQSTFFVEADCGPDPGGTITSSAVSTTTWVWGDVNGDGSVQFDDITLVFDGTQGVIPSTLPLETLDLAPCVPDGVIDDFDLSAVQAAFQGATYPCNAPCAEGPDLTEFLEFISCFLGPVEPVLTGCEAFDLYQDQQVDLRDFSLFANLLNVEQ